MKKIQNYLKLQFGDDYFTVYKFLYNRLLRIKIGRILVLSGRSGTGKTNFCHFLKWLLPENEVTIVNTNIIDRDRKIKQKLFNPSKFLVFDEFDPWHLQLLKNENYNGLIILTQDPASLFENDKRFEVIELTNPVFTSEMTWDFINFEDEKLEFIDYIGYHN